MVKSFSFVEIENVSNKAMKDTMDSLFKDVIAKHIRKECKGGAYEYFTDALDSGLGRKVKEYIGNSSGVICDYKGCTDTACCVCAVSIGAAVEYVFIKYTEG